MDYVENPFDATTQMRQWRAFDFGCTDALIGYKIKASDVTGSSDIRKAYVRGYLKMREHMRMNNYEPVEMVG